LSVLELAECLDGQAKVVLFLQLLHFGVEKGL
jgi:hypothetical protein